MKIIHIYKKHKPVLHKLKYKKKGLCGWIITAVIDNDLYEIALATLKETDPRSFHKFDIENLKLIRRVKGVRVVKIYRREELPKTGKAEPKIDIGNYYMFVNKKGVF